MHRSCMRTDTVKTKVLKHHESKVSFAFAAITDEPYTLYSFHISKQNTVCA